MKPRLYMIIPCYNEEKVLPITSEMFLEELNLLIAKDKISENSRILFVNDGSKDKTWDLIKELSEKGRTFHRDLSEPKQRTSKCCSGRNDGSKGCCGHYYFN